MPMLSSLISPLKLNKKSVVRSSPIQRLPPEILQEIFYIHVWVNIDTPVRLILVCHSWKSAALYPALWGRIFYGEWTDYRRTLANHVEIDDGCGVGSLEMGMGTIGNIGIGLCDRIDGMVHCTTQESLNRAIARAGSSHFELTVRGNEIPRQKRSKFEPKFWNLDANAFFSRCRLLRFITHDGLSEFTAWIEFLGQAAARANSSPPSRSTADVAGTEGRGVHFAALEEFLYLGRIEMPLNTRDILEVLQVGCPRLHTLAFPSINDDDQTRALLRRIQKLSTRDISESHYSDWISGPKVFQNIRELHVSYSSPIFPSSTPMPALKKVSMKDMPLHIIHMDIFCQLTHLTVGCWSHANLTLREEVRALPLLTYLAIYGHLGYINLLQAPNLDTLIIRDIHKWTKGQWSPTRAISNNVITDISPQILHVDDLHRCMTAREFMDFIRRIGQNVKELYITYIKEGKTVSMELINGLAGEDLENRRLVDGRSKKGMSVCPLLRRLDVLAPQTSSSAVQIIAKRNLQRLVDSPSSDAGGLSSLRRIRYGTYPPRNSRDQTWDAYRKWWMIQWEDLLWL